MQATNPILRAFTLLGEFLRQVPSGRLSGQTGLERANRIHFSAFLERVENEQFHNPWFTPEAVRKALAGISVMLDPDVLRQWLSRYREVPAEGKSRNMKTVGLVPAGNVPLVGFHDILCVLLSGHRVLIKPSSKDDRMIRSVAGILESLEPELTGRIVMTEAYLTGTDAVIATGSDNSARYFDYYFRDIPHIIRRNRNGVGVLSGTESDADLEGLGDDIFTYFGLGCRNVTKIYVPESYDLGRFMASMDRFSGLGQHHKYSNNVEYYRSIFLMNRQPFLDNGVLLLRESSDIPAPVGVVHYERYKEAGHVRAEISARAEQIQCVVSADPLIPDRVSFGNSQSPMPWDYADRVDTLEFLLRLN